MSDADEHGPDRPHDASKEMRAKLDELQEEIDEAEADADKAGGAKPKETFMEPGRVGTDKVDNTIAPPG
ncbi:MAG TPA: hypothetical protein VGI06_16995 [Acidimicrobiales bacterium]|jgi:hypothetical protein